MICPSSLPPASSRMTKPSSFAGFSTARSFTSGLVSTSTASALRYDSLLQPSRFPSFNRKSQTYSMTRFVPSRGQGRSRLQKIKRIEEDLRYLACFPDDRLSFNRRRRQQASFRTPRPSPCLPSSHLGCLPVTDGAWERRKREPWLVA